MPRQMSTPPIKNKKEINPMPSKAIGKETVVLNVVVDRETYSRISNGTQKVVFEYFDRKRAIEEWYGKWSGTDKTLVVKVWCNQRKKGSPSISFECICIWDSDNWSWFGWLPDDKRYDEFDEPGEDYFVLYLGDEISPSEEVI